METENKRKILMIVSLILVAIVLAGNIYALIDLAISKNIPVNAKDNFIVDFSFTIIALISAILYISAGFKKTSALYFKFFLYTFIISELILLFIEVILVKQTFFKIIGTFIAFILLNVLFGTKDLGKKKSLILSIIILICFIFTMIYYMFTSSKSFIDVVFWNIDEISLSVVLIVMMLLKYYDKSLRNTK